MIHEFYKCVIFYTFHEFCNLVFTLQATATNDKNEKIIYPTSFKLCSCLASCSFIREPFSLEISSRSITKSTSSLEKSAKKTSEDKYKKPAVSLNAIIGWRLRYSVTETLRTRVRVI